MVIKVRNLERSRKFYTEVLGMEVMMDVPAIGGLFLANNRRDHHEIALFSAGEKSALGYFHQGRLIDHTAT